MAMDPMDREPNVYNRETNVYETERRGSSTLAYLIGGLVIALGLLAFLFYGGTDRDEVTTTGSTATQTETAPSASPPPAVPATPTTPTSPTSPAPSAPSTSPQQ